MGSLLFRQDLEIVEIFGSMITKVCSDRICYRNENVTYCENLYFDEDIKEDCFNILSQLKQDSENYVQIFYYNKIIYAINSKSNPQEYASSKISPTTYGYIFK